MTPTTTSRTDPTYRGPAGVGAPRLAALPGVHRADTAPSRVLEVERHDTDDHRLAAAGIGLAVSRGGDERPHWRLDLPDGDTAERLTVPLAADAAVAPAVPAQLDELVRGVVRDRAVRPAGRIRTVRTETRLLDADDRVLATVVHDDVTLATLGRATDVEGWTEAQIRGAGARDMLVVEIGNRLLELGLRPAAAAGEAELDRLMRPASRALRRPARDRRASAGAVLLDHLAAQVDRLAVEDLRVRRDEPDAVHQFRVASRRLRSALQAYRPLLERGRTDAVVTGLRDLAGQLAPARDAEVLRERISTGLRSLDPELLLGPVQARVTRHFARVEAEARAHVLTALDGAAYASLRRDLDDLVADPPFTKRAGRPARKVLPAQLATSARRLKLAMDVATDPATPGAERDVAVHAARKAGKRLRYATEVARPVVGKGKARGLRELQEALGEHQDTVIARVALRELGALAHGDGENGFSFGVLYGRDAARAERIEAGLPALWRAARP